MWTAKIPMAEIPLEPQTCRNIRVANDISQKSSWIKKHREIHKLTHICNIDKWFSKILLEILCN